MVTAFWAREARAFRNQNMINLLLDCRSSAMSYSRIAGPKGEIFRLSGADEYQLSELMAVPVVAARPASIRNFQACKPRSSFFPCTFIDNHAPLKNGFDFEFNSARLFADRAI
jgi:hypothetical protein